MSTTSIWSRLARGTDTNVAVREPDATADETTARVLPTNIAPQLPRAFALREAAGVPAVEIYFPLIESTSIIEMRCANRLGPVRPSIWRLVEAIQKGGSPFATVCTLTSVPAELEMSDETNGGEVKRKRARWTIFGR